MAAIARLCRDEIDELLATELKRMLAARFKKLMADRRWLKAPALKILSTLAMYRY